jgi:CheY-like chemotaxis protein
MHTPIRLLIADDSEIIRRAICVLLQAQTGIAVCSEAQDYADLLKELSVSTADAVLMDMRMPGEGRFDPSTIKGHLNGSYLLALRRRSQKSRMTWPRLVALAERWLPSLASFISIPICASTPDIRGKSRMQQSCTCGSVRGALGQLPSLPRPPNSSNQF